MRRRTAVSVLVAALLALACAQPACAVTQNASVKATVVKPLSLTSLQDLDLGIITLLPGNWSGATMGISRTGIVTCPAATLLCTGTAQVAKYKVTGTNKQLITITAPAVTLVNQRDPTQTLRLTLDSPGQVTLTSSGEPGIVFALGGSVALSSSTATGDYKGTLNVTVDYP